MTRRVSTCYGLALIPPLCVVTAQLSSDPVLALRVPAGPGGLTLETWAIRFFGFAPIARLPEFVMGMYLGWCLRRRPLRLGSSRAAALEFATLLLLVLALVILGSHASRRAWLDSGLMAPLFLMFVTVLASGMGPFARLLSTRPLQVLGDASYALYILQEPVLIWTAKLPGIDRLSAEVSLLLFLAILTSTAVGSQRLIGEPARGWVLGFRRPSSGALPGQAG
jgi:peptidoglycan/LPS O-acetylase OafA/YrhL